MCCGVSDRTHEPICSNRPSSAGSAVVHPRLALRLTGRSAAARTKASKLSALCGEMKGRPFQRYVNNITSQPASAALIIAVMGANVICSLMAVVKNDLTAPDPVSWGDVGRIWLYNIVWFVATDVLKLLALWGLGESRARRLLTSSCARSFPF